MTLDEQYATVCLPSTVRAIGRRLRPLTIGHLLILTRLGCRLIPWVSKGETSGDGDAFSVVQVCSRDWRGSQKVVDSRWGSIELRWLAFLWRGVREPLIERAKVIRYIVRGLNAGPNSKTDPAKTTSIVGSKLAIWFSRFGQMGMPREAIMDLPVAVAEWDLAHADARELVVSLRADSTEDLDSYTRKIMAEDEDEARKASGMPTNWRRRVL